MIIKTLHVVCDHDGCTRWHEGDQGVSQALPLIRQIRALGWVASDGRQYCPEHIDMADVAGEWLERQRESDHLAAMQDSVNRTVERIEVARRTGAVVPRPCCTTGPNHHPACQESKQ